MTNLIDILKKEKTFSRWFTSTVRTWYYTGQAGLINSNEKMCLPVNMWVLLVG